MIKKTCIIVAGPTAVGKTRYGIELAQKYHTSIISGDSRQCFKELNAGVAKPTEEQLRAVKHYFINTHSIDQAVNAKIFEEYALAAVREIFEKNDVAILVGGTGMYLKAFSHGLDAIPDVPGDIRDKIKEQFANQGITWLSDEIRRQDPEYYSAGEIQNPQRMMRALEVKIATGKSILGYRSGREQRRDFDIRRILLEMPSGQLYARINQRVDQMMADGLLREAEELFPHRHLNALQTLGYREMFDYIEGRVSLTEAVEKIKINTRHYAKRQLTYFKKFLPEYEVTEMTPNTPLP
jgi:tRNA dimethylallyltransferase